MNFLMHPLYHFTSPNPSSSPKPQTTSSFLKNNQSKMNNLRLSRSIKNQLLNKFSIKKLFMLLSFSIFSILFSISNCPSFLKPYNFHIFTFPLRIVTHTIDKSCIFLLCNGILVFIAKNSGLIKGSTFRITKNKEISHETGILDDDYMEEISLVSGSETLAEERAPMEEQEEEEEEDKEVINGESGIAQQGDDELYEEDDDHDVWNTPMSTDELNKKFDEFIRKMKEEIKDEDQQKLVVVK